MRTNQPACGTGKRRRTAPAVPLLLVALALAACQSTPPAPPTALRRSLEALEKEGVKALEEGRYAWALRLFREAETIARSTDNRVALANAFNNQGAVLQRMGRTEDAARALRAALELNEALQRTEDRGKNYLNLFVLELRRPETDLARAREYNRKAAEIFEDLGDEAGELHARNNEGVLRLLEEDFDGAEEIFHDVRSDADTEETARIHAASLSNLGRVAEKTGRLDEALRFYEQALALDRTLELFTGVAVNLEAIARVQVRRGRKDRAVEALQRALDVVLLGLEWKPWINRLLGRCEKLLEELGRPAEARKLRERVRLEMERAAKEKARRDKARYERILGELRLEDK